MKSIKTFLSVTGSLFTLCCVASGAIVLDQSGSIAVGDPTQTGRLPRNGVPQDWTSSEPFPGVINTTNTYQYHTFTIPAATLASGRFVQIELEDLGAFQGNLFVSAYSSTYLPNFGGAPNFGLDLNWLGDAGFSPNLFDADPVFLQVLVPADSDLVVVVNSTGDANEGVGEQFRLIIENFSTVRFTAPGASPTPTPIPTPTPTPSPTPANPYGEITDPAPGSTLTSSTVTFAWGPGNAATAYWLTVGSTLGGTDIFSSGQTGGRSSVVRNIPTDGRTIFVRLRSLISGVWYNPPQDYTYTAFPAAVLTPVIAPKPGTYKKKVTVAIACATPQATIRYTLDGSIPTATSTAYQGPFVINQKGTVIVRAKAFKTGVPESQPATTTYKIK